MGEDIPVLSFRFFSILGAREDKKDHVCTEKSSDIAGIKRCASWLRPVHRRKMVHISRVPALIPGIRETYMTRWRTNPAQCTVVLHLAISPCTIGNLSDLGRPGIKALIGIANRASHACSPSWYKILTVISQKLRHSKVRRFEFVQRKLASFPRGH